ncbi:MAG: zinc-ribbon domain-containing protein [Abitibacteriaceae bacterium]|nr:zinc-ribbon domain-containing protein [Abditibacteriaceae bacterium]
MSLTCRHCGFNIPDNENFCPDCGACANCGLLRGELKEGEPNRGFCPNCGANLTVYRSGQDITRWIPPLLKGIAILGLSSIALISGCFGACAAILIVSGGTGNLYISSDPAVSLLIAALIVLGFSIVGLRALLK